MNYRVADEYDFNQLAEMRWDFKMEGKEESDTNSIREEFLKECTSFFVDTFHNKTWTHWIAEEKDIIVSHISVNHIRKVPKPSRFFDEYAYVTNVYTRPKYRGNGIGSKLMDYVLEWAEKRAFDVMIVWPSDDARSYYSRKGFVAENDVMELAIRSDA